MKTAIRSLIMIVVVAVVAPVAFAQEFHRNAYGMYAAPVIYGFAEGTRYQLDHRAAVSIWGSTTRTRSTPVSAHASKPSMPDETWTMPR